MAMTEDRDLEDIQRDQDEDEDDPLLLLGVLKEMPAEERRLDIRWSGVDRGGGRN